MKILFEAIVGSQAYGTATLNSDEDRKLVYQQSNEDILSFRYREQIEYSKDKVGYEVRRFLELLKSANPTVLELLFSPDNCIISNSPAFTLIVEQRDKFLTKKCRDSFGGYAHAQLVKAKGLNKKFNWEANRIEKKEPLDFCYLIIHGQTVKFKDYLIEYRIPYKCVGLVNLDHAPHCYGFYIIRGNGGIFAENSDTIIVSSVPKGEVDNGIVVYNKDSYKIYLKDWGSYQTWLKERNTDRYVDNINSGQKIDGKNMLHARRLLDMAMEIPVEKTLHVKRRDADRLLQIRRGEVKLQELINKAEVDLKKLDDLYAQSDLPDKVDEDFLNDLLLMIRKSY